MQKTPAFDLCSAENQVSVKLQACGAGSNSIRRTEVSTLCTSTVNIVRQSTQRHPGRLQYRGQAALEPNVGTVNPGTHPIVCAARSVADQTLGCLLRTLAEINVIVIVI